MDFLRNHDRIGNRAYGERLTTLAPARLLRAMTAMLLLSPHIPLMFMGEERGETRPFTFFTDFEGDLADAVRDGRRKEFAHFSAFDSPDARASVPDPKAECTFISSRIDWTHLDTARGCEWHSFVRRLLTIRQQEIVPHHVHARGGGGSVLLASEKRVAVDWQLDGAVLRLRANFDDCAASLPAAEGLVIFAAPCAVHVNAMPPATMVAVLQREG